MAMRTHVKLIRRNNMREMEGLQALKEREISKFKIFSDGVQ